MIFKILLLAALVRLLIATDKPFLCSILYAGLVLLFGLICGGPLVATLISTGLAFVCASVYFCLLDSIHDGFFWWITLGAGAFVGLV